MEIKAKTFAKLIGISPNHAFLSDRNVARKQYRKLKKKLVGTMSDEEIRQFAKIHPIGDVEVVKL